MTDADIFEHDWIRRLSALKYSRQFGHKQMVFTVFVPVCDQADKGTVSNVHLNVDVYGILNQQVSKIL